MAKACVSQNFGIDGGVLSIQPWSTARVVFDTTFNSVGDGSFGAQISPPGKLMIDSGIQSWTSDSPLPCRLLFRVQRAYRDVRVSNPNAVQIRDRWTTSLSGTNPPIPDTASTFQGQTGAALDHSANSVGLPYAGQYWVFEDAGIVEDWFGPLPAGGVFKFWYRANLWTPPPWSNNANANDPYHTANIRSTRIQIMAFPAADPAVTA